MNWLARLADEIGRYTRLTCPQEIRYRGVSPAEDKRHRTRMADHIASHQQ